MMIDAVITRLSASVPALLGRVQGAAQFTALVQANAMPTATPAAYVLPLGLRGGRAEAATGAYTQLVDEVVAVVLAYRSHDVVGAAGVDPLSDLIRSTVNSIAGWAPGDETGVFTLARGFMVSVSAGLLVYQIEFSITDQLRIVP